MPRVSLIGAPRKPYRRPLLPSPPSVYTPDGVTYRSVSLYAISAKVIWDALKPALERLFSPGDGGSCHLFYAPTALTRWERGLQFCGGRFAKVEREPFRLSSFPFFQGCFFLNEFVLSWFLLLCCFGRLDARKSHHHHHH